MMACAPFHAGEPRSLKAEAEAWRAEHRLIDLHQHVNSTEEPLRRCVQIMDAVGVGVVVNLSGGTVTHKADEVSEFQWKKELADRLFPGRFLLCFNLDYTGWDEPDDAEHAVRQVEEAHRLGAAGLKEFKRLGLYLRDRGGRLVPVDDPKLDPVCRRSGELGMPVSIHVADPQAFWRTHDSTNEKLDVLADLPDKDFAWSGRFEAGVKLDRRLKVWTTELRIPFDALGVDAPRVGERWRLNLYRHSVAEGVFPAWSPTARATAHTPERFGWIEFVE